VSVEVAFKVKESVPGGATVSLGLSVISGSTVGFVGSYTFTVSY